jgi:hypothetical protein
LPASVYENCQWVAIPAVDTAPVRIAEFAVTATADPVTTVIAASAEPADAAVSPATQAITADRGIRRCMAPRQPNP